MDVIWILNKRLMATASAALAGVRFRHGVDATRVRAVLDAVKAFLIGCMFLVVVDGVDPGERLGVAQVLQGGLFALCFLSIVLGLLLGRPRAAVRPDRAEHVLRTTFLFLCACVLMAFLDSAFTALVAFAVFVHAERLVAFSSAGAAA